MNFGLWTNRQQLANRVWVFCDGGLGVADVRQAAYAEDEAKAVAGVRMQAGCGALVRDESGSVLDWAWRTLPPVNGRPVTNNEAEYAGLLLGVELARRWRPAHVIFVLDSAVVVGQMQGRFAVNSRALKRWHAEATVAVSRLPRVEFRAVPRAWNALADALARQAGLPWGELKRAIEDGINCELRMGE